MIDDVDDGFGKDVSVGRMVVVGICVIFFVGGAIKKFVCVVAAIDG